ncbi:lytic murein transglycosylase [Mesorhizobium sp. M7A.F.Ca.US.010.02.1.1]|nr:lytic murein transglycosylase [Mesorhizobium sp. M7A.F.Ca.US.010.02.1.1]
MASRHTPLCPAGHLPRKGGDWMSFLLSPIVNVARRAPRSKLPISPLAGEMAGRPEGGAQVRLRQPHS